MTPARQPSPTAFRTARTRREEQANEKAREAHHVTKVSNENATGAEKTTTDVATETD